MTTGLEEGGDRQGALSELLSLLFGMWSVEGFLLSGFLCHWEA